MKKNISVIIPARNEANSLRSLIPLVREQLPDAQIIIVDDASEDNTAEVCESLNLTRLHQPYRIGNGGAIKRGAREASGDILLMMDADGQHRPEDIPRLLSRFHSADFQMVIGARRHRSQASTGRSLANRLYNRLASWMVGQEIKDLTSGFRVVDAKKFKEFLYLLPNGFSYPTTITMSFFRTGYPVAYEMIDAEQRDGKSHIKPLKDGMRFLLIIFKVGSLYSPLKLFLPIAALTFTLGCALYGYTFFTQSRFTNMSALLYITSLLVFLIGLVSEQITALMFSRK